MKKFQAMNYIAKPVSTALITFSLIAGTAGSTWAAGIDLTQYYFVSGGFGRDGATSAPTPLPNSIKSAGALFKAMDTSVNQKNEKAAGLIVDGDVVGLSCSAENCNVNVVVRKTQTLPPIMLNSRVQFNGLAAKNIYQVLPPDRSGRIGASIRTVANVACRQVSAARLPVDCEIRNVNLSAFTLEDIVKNGGLKRVQAEYLVKAFSR